MFLEPRIRGVSLPRKLFLSVLVFGIAAMLVAPLTVFCAMAAQKAFPQHATLHARLDFLASVATFATEIGVVGVVFVSGAALADFAMRMF